MDFDLDLEAIKKQPRKKAPKWSEREIEELQNAIQKLERVTGPVDNLSNQIFFYVQISKELAALGIHRSYVGCKMKYDSFSYDPHDSEAENEAMNNNACSEAEPEPKNDETYLEAKVDRDTHKSPTSVRDRKPPWSKEEQDIVFTVIKDQREKEHRMSIFPLPLKKLCQQAAKQLSDCGFQRDWIDIHHFWVNKGSDLYGYSEKNNDGSADDDNSESSISPIVESRTTERKVSAIPFDIASQNSGVNNSTEANSKATRQAKRHMPHQRALLDAEFAKSHYPTKEQEELLMAAGLSKGQVSSAFGFRRTKFRIPKRSRRSGHVNQGSDSDDDTHAHKKIRRRARQKKARRSDPFPKSYDYDANEDDDTHGIVHESENPSARHEQTRNSLPVDQHHNFDDNTDNNTRALSLGLSDQAKSEIDTPITRAQRDSNKDRVQAGKDPLLNPTIETAGASSGSMLNRIEVVNSYRPPRVSTEPSEDRQHSSTVTKMSSPTSIEPDVFTPGAQSRMQHASANTTTPPTSIEPDIFAPGPQSMMQHASADSTTTKPLQTSKEPDVSTPGPQSAVQRSLANAQNALEEEVKAAREKQKVHDAVIAKIDARIEDETRAHHARIEKEMKAREEEELGIEEAKRTVARKEKQLEEFKRMCSKIV